MGSGIFAGEVEIVVQCECWEDGCECDNEWDQYCPTDDWGNIDYETKCPSCKHTVRIEQDKEDYQDDDYDPYDN
mgnify:CR=1 FL=1